MSIPEQPPSLVDLFTTESLAYLERNYGDANLASVRPLAHLDNLLERHPVEAGSVLEIGCGPGANLPRLAERCGATRLVGTEPSPEVVERLRSAFPHYDFVVSDSLTLPFATDEFDLVVMRSVLHWIDREYLLQVLGESLRVARQHLIVSDFSPSTPYSTEYKHRPGYRTFKMSYRPLLEASNLVDVLGDVRNDPDDDWEAVETVLYRVRAVDDAFPLRAPPGARGRARRTS